MDVTEVSVWTLLGLVVLVTAVRYSFERVLSRLFKATKIESASVHIIAKSIVMVMFNVIILLLFGLLTVDLFALANVGRGIIFVAVGLGVALLVSLLSYFAIKAGYGEGYGTLLAKTPKDKVLTWITFLVLVGPAEDLFFIGFAQNLLLGRMGWVSIVAYVVLFTLYHYANVLSGVDKERGVSGDSTGKVVGSHVVGGELLRDDEFDLWIHHPQRG